RWVSGARGRGPRRAGLPVASALAGQLAFALIDERAAALVAVAERLAELVGALAEARGLLVEVVGSLGAGLAAQFGEAAQRLVQPALGFGALGSCGAAVAGGELARAAL